MASLAILGNAETFRLLAQDINTFETTPIGTLKYDSDTGKSEVTEVPESLEHGAYRLGIQKGPIFKSYSYSEVSCEVMKCYHFSDTNHPCKLTEPFGYELIIVTKPDGEVSTLSFKKSSTPGLTPVVKPMRPGADPLILYKKEQETAGISNPLIPDEEVS
jgi:hypothetical protein